MARSIDIHVRLDPASFRRFCAFDSFRRQRRWFAPVMIAMVLITLAVGALLGLIPIGTGAAGVLMGLGIAVPMVIFGLYFIQIEAQIARQHLKEVPEVYALRLSDAGVRVTNPQQPDKPAELEWDKLWAAFRHRDCVYLYVSPDRALILPNGQADADDDAVWRLISRNMGERRCTEI